MDEKVICKKCNGEGIFESGLCDRCRGDGKVLWINNLIKEEKISFIFIKEVDFTRFVPQFGEFEPWIEIK